MTGQDMTELADLLETWSMQETCEHLQLDEAFVVECIELGITGIESSQQALPLSQWQFTVDAILRIKKARRLQHDLEIRLSDLPLVLDLLDEVESLRHEVDVLRKRLSHWEPED